MKPITCEQFKERLAVLCVQSGLTCLPRKQRDRHILFKSMVLDLNRETDYVEKILTEC